MVGLETSDDAGIYQINAEQALVQTIDFFTPIVDDPFLFGQVAAANALSDIYAMGAQPLTAVNIVGFPLSCLDNGILRRVLDGGADKMIEAGVVLLGGHTVEDEEPKYGLSVTGIVHPQRYWSNALAQEGQVLILTKPIGTGIIASAIQADLVDPASVEIYHQSMITLNKYAADILHRFNVRGVTDVTGFSLLGHAYELAEASNVTIEITADAVPLLPQTLEMADMGFVTVGGYSNQSYLADKVVISTEIPENLVDILYDPQTSGGLLAAVDIDQLGAILEAYKSQNILVHVIGKVKAQADYSSCVV